MKYRKGDIVRFKDYDGIIKKGMVLDVDFIDDDIASPLCVEVKTQRGKPVTIDTARVKSLVEYRETVMNWWLWLKQVTDPQAVSL